MTKYFSQRTPQSAKKYIQYGLSKYLAKPISNKIFDIYNNAGKSILTFDWDNLIILDACRYDEFINISSFKPKNIESRITMASKTPDFKKNIF